MSIGQEGQFNPNDALKEEALKAYKDAMEAKSPARTPIESAGLRPCPHCGYCPTCGRPNNWNVPYYPPYPYQPGFWYGPSITCGGISTNV